MTRLAWVLCLFALPSMGCSTAGPGRSLDAPPPLATFGSIGVIDVQRVLSESVTGMAARQRLEEEKATMQRTLDIRRQELEALRQELARTGRSRMTSEACREKQQRFEDLRRSAARLADDFSRQLEKSDGRFMLQALIEIAALIKQLGEQRQYAVIFEERALDALKAGQPAVLYSVSRVARFLGPPVFADDLTGDVITLFDAAAASRGMTRAPR